MTALQMDIRGIKAIWGTRVTWFNIIATWEGKPSDLRSVFPEFFL